MAALRDEIHFQAAASGARGLFEIWVDMELISRNLIEKNVEKYHTFPEIDRFNRAKRIVEYSDKNPDLKINDSVQRQVVSDSSKKQKTEAFLTNIWGAKSNNAMHWSGEKMWERVKCCSAEVKTVYYEHYSLLSWYVHSGSTGYANLNKDALRLCFANSHIIAQKAF